MADDVAVNFDGLEEINKTFEELNNDMRLKGGRSSLRKAANLVRDAAKANAMRLDDPETSESIAENIAVRWSGRFFKSTGDLKFRVGVMGGARGRGRKGKSPPGGDTFYWRFLEFGTVHHAPIPFMRRALSENVTAAINQFVVNYDKALARALRRARAGG